MKIVSGHGFPKSDGSLPTDDPLDLFKNERDYIAQSGRMKTTLAAMDWAATEIESLRLAAKPAEEGVRERIITTCANIANRYRPNLTARDIEQQIRALSTQEPKR